MQSIQLKRGKDRMIDLRHPWIFSGALWHDQDFPEDGTPVRILKSNGSFVGVGHYHTGSIAIRILSDIDGELDQNFWTSRIRDSIHMRLNLGIYHPQRNNALRLVNGEGDGLSGLILDYYNGIAVVQCHTPGMYHARHTIQAALLSQEDLPIHSVFLQVKFRGLGEDQLLYGEQTRTTIKENDVAFYVDVQNGQKTGFFLDQRDNRHWLEKISEGKTVLNTFCYNGGFSLFALKGGASKVVSIDSSKMAMEQLEQNLILNDCARTKHTSITEDVMAYLKDSDEQYDIVVLDPPAFAKSRKKSHNAVQAYKRLNIMGMKHLKPGGILMSFSCSQVVGESLFYNTLVSAGLEIQQDFRVIKKLGPGADHPYQLFHPEGPYLKGFMLRKN